MHGLVLSTFVPIIMWELASLTRPWDRLKQIELKIKPVIPRGKSNLKVMYLLVLDVPFEV